jgi:phosphopantothenate---cysteine ligase (CTP)
MKILITAGGTREYIDDVRVLTNISTGKLGATIVDRMLINSKINIRDLYYLCSKSSIIPEFIYRGNVIYADTVEQVMSSMKEWVPKVDVVIHSMAISDFGFESTNTKLKSDSPEAFIDSLRARIKKNPKIISYIKEWNPNVKLISFKFEVGLEFKDLLDIAYDSLVRNNCDFVIANDKKEMQNSKEHIAYLIDKDKNYIKCEGKEDISLKIINKIF